MPVYAQTYESYSGDYRSRFRWMVTIGQELRVLLSRRMFIFLVLLGNFHLLLRILQLYVLDVMSTDTIGPLSDLSEVGFDETGAWVYFDFLRMQSPLIFLTLIYAGSGMICNDFRNNLVEVYFSKPINWKDYVLGKFGALVTIGMSLTAVPALFMALTHVVFKPEMASVRESVALTPPIVAFSLLVVGSASLAILASSCLVNSSRFASVAIFMLVLINTAFSVIVSVLTATENYLALSFPISLNNVGEFLFQEHRYQNPVDLSWGWSALYVALVCAIALAIVCRKAQFAERGR
jgi:ABC-type transport system involved in multi-copper enzyme maturation permease subunit